MKSGKFDLKLFTLPQTTFSLQRSLFSSCHNLSSLPLHHLCSGLSLPCGLGPIVISILMIMVSTYLPDHCHSGLEISHHFLPPFLYFYFQDSKLPRTMLSGAMANLWSGPQLDTDTTAQQSFYSSPANSPDSCLSLLLPSPLRIEHPR